MMAASLLFKSQQYLEYRTPKNKLWLPKPRMCAYVPSVLFLSIPINTWVQRKRANSTKITPFTMLQNQNLYFTFNELRVQCSTENTLNHLCDCPRLIGQNVRIAFDSHLIKKWLYKIVKYSSTIRITQFTN